MKDLGMVASISPQWVLFHSDGFLRLTNPEVMRHFLPLRTMHESGIPVAFGCDVPATIMLEPRWAFIGAVERTTRTGYSPMPEERISMTTALRMHTMGSAYAAFEEKVKGSLEPGKMADVVVWSHDLLTASRAELRELRPEMVFINGELIHQ